MKKFEELGIEQSLLETIKEKGFEEPTEIQEKAIPLVAKGQDVIGGAATGSGKTLAFGVGIIQRCERGKGIQGLVLTPTRELAEQVAKELRAFSKKKALLSSSGSPRNCHLTMGINSVSLFTCLLILVSLPLDSSALICSLRSL